MHAAVSIKPKADVANPHEPVLLKGLAGVSRLARNGDDLLTRCVAFRKKRSQSNQLSDSALIVVKRNTLVGMRHASVQQPEGPPRVRNDYERYQQ